MAHTKKNKTNNHSSKTKKTRPSPSESATSFPVGSIRRGNSGNRYVVVIAKNGIQRWTPIEGVELNGVRLLTVNHLAKNIGKPVVYYSRMYEDTFPSVGELEKMEKATFIPNGHAQVDRKKKLLENWLRNQKPAVQPGHMFILLGKGEYGAGDYGNEDYDGMQVDSKHPQQVSDRVMNMEAFIKV